LLPALVVVEVVVPAVPLAVALLAFWFALAVAWPASLGEVPALAVALGELLIALLPALDG
jgi:hypothetical protein